MFNYFLSTGLDDATIAQPTATPNTTTTYSLVITERATGCSSVADTVIVTVDTDLPTADACNVVLYLRYSRPQAGKRDSETLFYSAFPFDSNDLEEIVVIIIQLKEFS